MLDFVDFLTTKVNNLIKQGARSRMSDKEFLEREIARWKNSPQRLLQIKGYLYFYKKKEISRKNRYFLLLNIVSLYLNIYPIPKIDNFLMLIKRKEKEK